MSSWLLLGLNVNEEVAFRYATFVISFLGENSIRDAQVNDDDGDGDGFLKL